MSICRTANYKPHALRRIRKYLSLEKAKLLCNAFINSQFNYGPLAWIFCRNKQYIKIQKIHQKALTVVYNSNKNYDELLRDNNEVSIHRNHLRALTCEVFKSLNNLNPEFMWSPFVFKNITYNIRKGPFLRLHAAKSTSYGINSVLFRGCLLWHSLPQTIKYTEYIVELKTKMKDLENIEFMYFMTMNSIKNKSFIHVVPCGCMKLFWYQCHILMAVCGCHIDITLVSASTG